MSVVVGALLSVLIPVCAVTSADAVDLPDRLIRLQDVAVLDCIAAEARAEVGDLVIAGVPYRTERLSLSRAALAALVRRRIPGLQLDASRDDDVIALRVPALVRPEEDAGCFATFHALAPDQSIGADDVSRTPCEAETAMTPPARDVVEAGEALTFTISVGPIRIEREVWTLQPAPHGANVFVRDADGAIFSIPLAADAEAAP